MTINVYLEEKYRRSAPPTIPIYAYLNAILLVAPSRDGLAAVKARIRDYLAWEKVEAELGRMDGTVDPFRKTQLQTKLQAARLHPAEIYAHVA